MSFNLRVASDNELREANHRSDEANRETLNIKEFSITPNSGIILPQSEAKILLEFVPHFIKKYETSLIVDIEDVGTDLLSLPISARSSVPSVSLLTSSVNMGRCFIFHSYEKQIKLSNESNLKARYFILPSKDRDLIKFTSAQAEVCLFQFYHFFRIKI